MLPLLSVLLRRGLLSVCVSLARTVGRFDGWLPRGGEPHKRGPMARARGRATPEAPTFQTLSPPPTAEVSKVAFERGRWDVRWWGRHRRARLAPTRPLASELNEGAPGSGVNAGTEMPGLACAAPRLYNLTHAHFTAGGSWNGERAQRVTQTHCDGAEGMGR